MPSRHQWLFLLAFAPALVGLGCGDAAAPTSDASSDPAAEVEAAENGDRVSYPTSSLAPDGEAAPGSVAQRLQDASLAAQVRMRLVQEDNLRRYDFDVEAQGGRVMLGGRVASADHRARAENLAGGVGGVREVLNRIEAPGAPPPSDETLASTAPPPEPETRPEPETPPAEREQATAAERTPAQSTPPAAAPETPPATASAAAAEPSYHTVRSGESLWVIARRYDLTVAQLRSLNDMRSDNLRPGQRLRVE